jgi:hypothetical protein
MALGLTRPMLEIEYQKMFLGSIGRPERMADLTAICEPIFLENVGTSTPHSPTDLHRLWTGTALLLISCFCYQVTTEV